VEEKPDHPGERGRHALASYFRVLQMAGKLAPRADAANEPARASTEQGAHEETESSAKAVRSVLERLRQPGPTHDDAESQ
jgi:hypothetical protein